MLNTDTPLYPSAHEAALVLAAQRLHTLVEVLSGQSAPLDMTSVQRSPLARDLALLGDAAAQPMPKTRVLAAADRVRALVLRTLISEPFTVPRDFATMTPWGQVINGALINTYTAAELVTPTEAAALVGGATRRALSLWRALGVLHTVTIGGRPLLIRDEVLVKAQARASAARDGQPGRGRQVYPSERAQHARATRARGYRG